MILRNCLQLLVVVSPDWNAVNAKLYRYQCAGQHLQWECFGDPIAVTLGKQGMAWGRGLQEIPHDAHLCKKEGDLRSPAGAFLLGPAFGNAAHASYAKHLPFLLITHDLESVDDPDSVHYNQFVTANTFPRDWKSSEKMHEVESLYDIGLVVQYNLHPVEAGKGSAIFMHIWRSEGNGTAGCTAMRASDLNELVAWLNPEKSPCLVQLPREEYLIRKSEWKLPELPEKI
jgi:L,D-peptidoglycan transpeptidase YkuD (ErfK/YbiS/YcfS/YnhG family)